MNNAPETNMGAEVVKSAYMAIIGANTPIIRLNEAANPIAVPLICE